MRKESQADPHALSPPPERGRSPAVAQRAKAGRVGVNFNRTKIKTALARCLRRDSTDVEMRLWQKLRNRQLGADFRRQHPAGSFVLDFYCSALRLVIELDGGQHNEPRNAVRDKARDQWLFERGATVLRFWNSDVTQNLRGVLEVIAATVSELQAAQMTPTRRWRADLPLSGGGKRSSRSELAPSEAGKPKT
jgi:very-short-patch-repair endonuclease